MLLLNENFWDKDRIIKMSFSNDWDGDDKYVLIQAILRRLKDLLIIARDTGRKAILLCNFNKGSFPPMSTALQLVSYMVSIKKFIDKGLLYTIVYTKSPEHTEWVKSILNIYTPVRPVNLVKNKEELKELLLRTHEDELFKETELI